MTVVQRSPNLGINIRLQPLSEAPKVLAIAPKPPVWWGWRNADKSPATELLAEWNEAATFQTYGTGMWCAVVENAPEAAWEIEFLPKIWFMGLYSDFKEIVAWTGKPVKWSLAPAPVPVSNTLFDQKMIELPDPMMIGDSPVPLSSYWQGQVMGLPLLIASGNTLSAMAYPGSPTGILTATAFVRGKRLGSVQLTLKRVTTYIPT